MKIRTFITALAICTLPLASGVTSAAEQMQKQPMQQMPKQQMQQGGVTSAPPISVEVTNFTITPAAPKAGDNVQIRATIKNTGTGTVASVPWGIGPQGAISMGTQTNVPPGSSFDVTATWMATAGARKFQVYVDPAGNKLKNTAPVARQIRELDINVMQAQAQQPQQPQQPQQAQRATTSDAMQKLALDYEKAKKAAAQPGTTGSAPGGTTGSAAASPALTSLEPASTVLVAQASPATVRLSAAAPSGGTVVALTSSNPAVLVVPGSVTVPAGAMSATFSMTPAGYDVTGSATVTAMAGGASRTGSYSVMAGSGIGGLDLPAIMAGGSTATGTVRLRVAPPSGSVTVRLRAIVGVNTSTQVVPASVTIGAGQTSATFSITAPAVSSNQNVNICVTTAPTECPTSDGRSASRTFTVGSPPGVTQIQVRSVDSPYSDMSTVLAGQPVRLTVEISSTAFEATTVAVTSSRPDIVPVPATISVPAGQTSNFFAQTGPVIALTRAVTAPTTVTLTATGGGQTKTATLTVQPGPQVSAVSVTPASTAGAGVVTGTVTLAQAAPTSGVAVALSSTSTAAVVPATVTVAAGQTSVGFSIATQAVTAATTATITATYAGAARTTALAITP